MYDTSTILVVIRGSRSFFIVFFFSSRRRHTRFSRDWSSDVCSSDLAGGHAGLHAAAHRGIEQRHREPAVKIGRASCRERAYISQTAEALKEKKGKEDK